MTDRIEFPLLSDFNPKGEVVRAYGVWREPDGFSERALFVVEAQGRIRFAQVAPFLHHVPDVCQLFAALDEVAGSSGESAEGTAGEPFARA